MTASTGSVAPSRSALSMPVAIGGCAIGAAVYIAAVDPSSTATYPGCLIRSFTGWWCPGCGLTRATHHLLHGDLTKALGYNALVVPIAVLLMLTWVGWLASSLGRRPPGLQRAAVPAWLGLATVAAAFMVLRNLQSFHVLRR